MVFGWSSAVALEERYSIIVEITKKMHSREVRSAPLLSLIFVKKRKLQLDISASSLLSTEDMDMTVIPDIAASFARTRVSEKDPDADMKIKTEPGRAV